MQKYFLFTILGMFLMWLILKIISSNAVENSRTTENFKQLAKTGQAFNLIRTNEFRELAKTTEFRNFVSGLAEDQIKEISKSLMQ